MANLLTIAAILGLIQGFAEFLPISSSAHLILARDYFHWSFGSKDFDLVFDTILHLGTMVAIVLYFWKDIVRLNKALFGLEKQAPKEETARDRRLAIYILVATIPAGLFGALGEERIEDIFRADPRLIVALLAGVGILMWLVDVLAKKARDEKSVTLLDAILIGCAQATALMPGVSRSGATITMGRALGLKREAAARFSFLLSTPAMVGAALWSSRKLSHHPIPHDFVPAMAIGFLVSAVVGFACIAGLLWFVRRWNLGLFTLYRLAVAGFVLWALVLHASPAH